MTSPERCYLNLLRPSQPQWELNPKLWWCRHCCFARHAWVPQRNWEDATASFSSTCRKLFPAGPCLSRETGVILSLTLGSLRHPNVKDAKTTDLSIMPSSYWSLGQLHLHYSSSHVINHICQTPTHRPQQCDVCVVRVPLIALMVTNPLVKIE